MIYNILFIDKEESVDTSSAFLEQLEVKEIFPASTKEQLTFLFITEDIHVILLNEEVITLAELESALDDTSLKYNDIPILIMGDYKENVFEKSSFLIYDFLDPVGKQQLSLNKVKFCQNLYKKELQHESNIKKLFLIDGLTKLPNRTKLISDVKDADVGITALALIDINSFKDINDFFGHNIADNVLKSVVSVINNIIKFVHKKVILYKFPADVYCLANTGLTKDEFEDIVTYVLGAINGEVLREDEHEIDLRATSGITFSEKNNKLITVDLALQAAKEQNKDYVVFYKELDNFSKYENNMKWTKKLRGALETDNIVVYFQPIIENKTKRVGKYECLVRLIDDEGKVVAPFFFLDVAKKANQYKNITKIVIEKAFKEFEHSTHDFSINISYEDIADKKFLYFVQDMLNKYNVANRVVWEILEDESIKNYNAPLNKFR
ncbi:GGDEF and EAL domain-containing protein [Arcobacteraceae bacterium]|nr:GGDEF and EAL domain-containing protein [Arcobacteraceae bacterium]